MPLEPDFSELMNLPGKVRQAYEKAHQLMGLQLLGDLQEFSPVDHGNLANSWRLQRRGALETSVATNVSYAMDVNEGTAPHDIYPSNARALRFTVNGQTIFAKHVHHPGTQGVHYVDKAIDSTQARVGEFVDQALSEAGLA